MKYKIAIFDLDGTILNTLDDLADSLNVVLQKFQMPLHTYEQVRFMVGNGIPKLIERAVPDGVSNPKYQQILSEYIKYYETHCAKKTAPYDGILNILAQMKSHGMKLAVNTNKVAQAAIELCNHYFPSTFDYVCGSCPQMPVKPSPDGVYKILHHFNLHKEDAVYIGDSDVDIQTGKNACIDVISAAWGFRGKEFLLQNGAEKIAQNAQELLKMIL